jgi:hypothetical protein
VGHITHLGDRLVGIVQAFFRHYALQKGASIMPKVLGLGGLFFKSADPAATRAWYARVLGIPFEEWGMVFTPDAAILRRRHTSSCST